MAFLSFRFYQIQLPLGELTTPLHIQRLATMSTSGLYRWAKFGWNLCCCVLSLLRNTHNAPQNRYNMTEIHNMSQRLQNLHHARKIRQSSLCGLRVMQADRQTNGQLNDILITILRAPAVLRRTMYHTLARWCESVVRATMKVYEKGGNLNLIKLK